MDRTSSLPSLFSAKSRQPLTRASPSRMRRSTSSSKCETPMALLLGKWLKFRSASQSDRDRREGADHVAWAQALLNLSSYAFTPVLAGNPLNALVKSPGCSEIAASSSASVGHARECAIQNQSKPSGISTDSTR
jgi:hypothetical protein